MLNLSKLGGFPLFESKPNFYDGDETLFSSVEGMKPTIEDDTYNPIIMLLCSTDGAFRYIDVEPWSGITMRENRQLQLNTVLQDLALTAGPEVQIPGFGCNPSGGDDMVPINGVKSFSFLVAGWLGWPLEHQKRKNLYAICTSARNNRGIYLARSCMNLAAQLTQEDADSWKQGSAALKAASILSVWSVVIACLCAAAALGLVGYKYWIKRRTKSVLNATMATI